MSTTLKNEKKRIARRFVQELLLRDWEFCSQTDDISLWTTVTEWTDKKALKVVVFVPSVTLEDVDAVMSDPSSASKIDKNTESKEEVRSITDTLKVYRTTLRSPMFGVASREMVTREALSYYPSPAERAEIGLRSVDEREERNVLLHVAEDATEEMPEVSKKYKRGRVFVAGVLAERVDGGVRLLYAVAADPGGSIPTFIVDSAVKLQVKKMAGLVEHVRQRAVAREKKTL